MGGPPGSQAAPLPSNLPFRLVSKTIGCGAYASIRKAVPLNQSGPVIAVKFINKDHAYRSGRLRPKQLMIELSLHKMVCPHDNIIRYAGQGEDAAWVWLCMELAEGGDLFDKIEADEGVGEDVAHLYFSQLCGAVSWCHGRGVAHRDVKPENMLLSAAGDLKLADFGLATKFRDDRTGQRKVCAMVCGSPPYIAPEILAAGDANSKINNNNNNGGGEGGGKVGYDPERADVWSCAIVLFVLLVGNTPWDSPVAAESYEYHDYVSSRGRPDDELWARVPPAALSLLRGMLRVDAADRFTLPDVRRHPWFTRPNPHLNDKGKAANPVGLATQMLESLRIDFSKGVVPRATASQPDAMDIDGPTPPPGRPSAAGDHFAATQPEPAMDEAAFDWEAPPPLGAGAGVSASQPLTHDDLIHADVNSNRHRRRRLSLLDRLAEDPCMSQFSATPGVPLTLTQQARQFKDIVPSHSLARFLSLLPPAQLLPMLLAALHRLNVPVADPPPSALAGRDRLVSLRIKTVDARQQPLQGNVVVETLQMHGDGGGGGGHDVLEVRFIKAKGDPLGWRRLFKQVAVLCKDGIVVPQ